jgi:hypothetical protein
MRTWALLLMFGVSGCMMANTSPTRKITDSVQNLNENTRWGRIGDAALLVEPAYRDTFVSAHQGWGNDIQLADTEIVHVQMASDAEHASAIVNYSWYAMDTMTLHETTIRQRWSAHSGGYVLTSEAVIKGDARLLNATASAADAAGIYGAD